MPRYSATLLDHVSSPRNAGTLPFHNAIGSASLAGQAPRITVYLRVKEHIVVGSGFTTFGCGAMIAAGSVVTELVKGKRLKDAASVTSVDVVKALGGMPFDKVFCADLVIQALRQAIETFEELSQDA